MQLCDYGCGQKATYQLKNGKWCCCKFWQRCPTKSIIGHIVSKETKDKISKAMKGRKPWNKGIPNSIQTRRKISKANKGQVNWLKGLKQPKETKDKISKAMKGRKAWNKGIPNSIQTRRKIGQSNKSTIKQIKEKYPTFAKVEEMRYKPGKEKEKVIQVHCKNHNCKNSKEKGGWFTPKSNNIIFIRAWSIEKINGSDSAYMYCSNECKQECPLYKKTAISLMILDEMNSGRDKQKLYTQEEFFIWREEVLNRTNFLCEYCGKPATDVHHSRPQKLEPGFVLDPDYGVACCENCHYKYGHKKGTECSTGNLANIICK